MVTIDQCVTKHAVHVHYTDHSIACTRIQIEYYRAAASRSCSWTHQVILTYSSPAMGWCISYGALLVEADTSVLRTQKFAQRSNSKPSLATFTDTGVYCTDYSTPLALCNLRLSQVGMTAQTRTLKEELQRDRNGCWFLRHRHPSKCTCNPTGAGRR